MHVNFHVFVQVMCVIYMYKYMYTCNIHVQVRYASKKCSKNGPFRLRCTAIAFS